MEISILLLVIAAIVSIVNVWKSVKIKELKRKQLYVHIVLTLFAAIAFFLSWNKQSTETAKLKDSKIQQKRHDDSAYAKLDSTYHATVKLYHIANYIDSSMERVKIKTEGIVASTQNLNDQEIENFKAIVGKHEELLRRTRELSFGLSNDMNVEIWFNFKFDSIADELKKANVESCNLSQIGYPFNNAKIDSISIKLKRELKRFVFNPGFKRTDYKHDFDDLYLIGSYDWLHPPKDCSVQITYEDGIFKVGMFGLPLKIDKNNGLSTIYDLNNATVYLNNSFDMIINAFEDYQKTDHHLSGISDMKIIQVKFDFGNINSYSLTPYNKFKQEIADHLTLDQNLKNK